MLSFDYKQVSAIQETIPHSKVVCKQMVNDKFTTSSWILKILTVSRHHGNDDASRSGGTLYQNGYQNPNHKTDDRVI